jgi:small subunit ribosomal protein S15
MLVISLAVLFSACDAKLSQERPSPLAELLLAYNPSPGLLASPVTRSKIPHMMSDLDEEIGRIQETLGDQGFSDNLGNWGKEDDTEDEMRPSVEFDDNEYDDSRAPMQYGFEDDDEVGPWGGADKYGFGKDNDDDEEEKDSVILFEIPDDEIRAMLVDDETQEAKRQSLKDRYEAWGMSLRGTQDESKASPYGDSDLEDTEPETGPINTGPQSGYTNKQEMLTLPDKHRLHPADVGSDPVQIAALTARIRIGTDHMRKNKKDFASRRGIEALVNKRRKLLEHVLAKKDVKTFLALCDDLGIAKDPFFLERQGARGRDRAIALKKAQEEELDFKF